MGISRRPSATEQQIEVRTPMWGPRNSKRAKLTSSTTANEGTQGAGASAPTLIQTMASVDVAEATVQARAAAMAARRERKRIITFLDGVLAGYTPITMASLPLWTDDLDSDPAKNLTG
ncbi:hypothetical protein BDW69DRAFT_189886 [Aspergillus filifer]